MNEQASSAKSTDIMVAGGESILQITDCIYDTKSRYLLFVYRSEYGDSSELYPHGEKIISVNGNDLNGRTALKKVYPNIELFQDIFHFNGFIVGEGTYDYFVVY